MEIYYSPSTGGFYSSELHGQGIPKDAMAITGARHRELLDGEANGKTIAAGPGGLPILTDPPPPTLADAKASKIADINAWKSSQRQTFEWNGHTWDSDEDGRANVMGVVLAGIAPPSGYWTSADNDDVPVTTVEEMQSMYGAMVAKAGAVHDRQRAMKREIENMTNAADVLAYPVGW